METGKNAPRPRANPVLSATGAAGSKPFCWIGDQPGPAPLMQKLLEQSLTCKVVSHGRRIPPHWHPLRRHLAYLGRAGSVLRHRNDYRAFFCVQQFIALYVCLFATLLRLPMPPLFLQALIYVPRPGLFGRLWRRLFVAALEHPALRIAFCHSQSEIDVYRREFPSAAAKFQFLRFAIDPVPPAAPAVPPYLFSAGMSCRDYATLAEAARRLPPGFPPIRIACKPADALNLVPPPNVAVHHDLWGLPFRTALAEAALVVVPLQPLPVSAGQLVFLQAMSAARPIIATRTATSVEFLDDACAWLVPPRDPDALAAAIQDAVNHPEKARAKAAAARARFEAAHSPEAIFRQCASAIAAAMPAS